MNLVKLGEGVHQGPGGSFPEPVANLWHHENVQRGKLAGVPGLSSDRTAYKMSSSGSGRLVHWN